MKIALIQCPVWGTYDPPIALAQLSGCLKQANYEVFVSDLNIKLYLSRSENYKNIWAWEQCSFWYNQERVDDFFVSNNPVISGYIEEIAAAGPKIAGFSVNAASRLSSIKVAGMLKRKNKELVVVFGGQLFSDDKFIESVLNEGVVDFVIPGEGEVAFVELARILESGRDVSSVNGVCFKDNARLVKTGDGKMLDNLDSLPFLDFSGLPLSDYDDSRHISFSASRGCIQKCVFCSSRSFWPGYRAMSGRRIFREIEFHKRELGRLNPDLSHVDFLDLMFNGRMNFLSEFCDLVIASKLKFFWTANMIIRPEMTHEIIEKMKDSGCEHIIFGIESGSQRVLDLMRKHYRISDADRIVRDMHNAGIKVTANFMFGFPGEKKEDFQETLAFIKRNAGYLDRVYPSRTFCAIEESSYLSGHREEFNIKADSANHLYWETVDGDNTYPERLSRCEEFCKLAFSLGIEVGSGVQTSVELDRWFSLASYYEYKGDFKMMMECLLRYQRIDPANEIILKKIKHYSKDKVDRGGAQGAAMILSEDDCGQSSSFPQRGSDEDSPAEEKPNIQRRFTWNIHYACNYRCPYCFFEGKWVEYGKRNNYFSVEQWMNYWNNIYENYGRCYMLITGGEPFVYPGFIDLIREISRIHYPINISTNTSGDLKSFVRKIDLDRVFLSVSFQPYFEQIDRFLEKVRFLKQYSFDGCINFVAYPPFLKDLEYYTGKFDSIGEKLKIIPFWGNYQGQEYPFAYTTQEKKIVGIDDTWFKKVRKKDSLCPAGYNSALIFPDGKVARCGQIGERALIGDFFSPEFKLLDKPLSCEAEYCPCDENKLFGD